MLTQARLHEMLHYDPDTGIVTWRFARRGIRAGMEFGRVQWQGYRQGMLDGHHYYTHRLAWFYVNGEWPPYDVDHINQNKGDNRLCNLRLATRSENKANTGKQITNTSGVRGVHWSKKDRCYVVEVKKGSRRVRKWGFVDLESARQYYLKTAKELFGEFVPEEAA
jgi:hypothetical protein